MHEHYANKVHESCRRKNCYIFPQTSPGRLFSPPPLAPSTVPEKLRLTNGRGAFQGEYFLPRSWSFFPPSTISSHPLSSHDLIQSRKTFRHTSEDYSRSPLGSGMIKIDILLFQVSFHPYCRSAMNYAFPGKFGVFFTNFRNYLSAAITALRKLKFSAF